MASVFWRDPNDNNRYYLGTPFYYNGFNYTAAAATSDFFAQQGFVQVQAEEKPDDRFNQVNHAPNDDGTWNSTPIDIDHLRARYKNNYKKEMKSILSDTDWMALEAYETGNPLPTTSGTVGEFRSQVRQVYLDRRIAIDASNNNEELIAIVTNINTTNPWPSSSSSFY